MDKARQVQEQVKHEARQAQEHVRHEARQVWEHVEHDTPGTRTRRARLTTSM